MKMCSRHKKNLCKQINPQNVENFYIRSARASGRMSWCKSCTRDHRESKEYKDGVNRRNLDPHNKRVRENYDLMHRYGITVEQRNKMLEEQNWSCAICHSHQDNFARTLAIDHNHKTGKIRKLLCPICNRYLGYIKENQDSAERLFEYIKNDG